MAIFCQIVYKEDLRKIHLSGTWILTPLMENEEISNQYTGRGNVNK